MTDVLLGSLFQDGAIKWLCGVHARRQPESGEAKQARLNKERDAKSNQRQKHYQNEFLNERILRQEQAAVTKVQQRHIRDLNESNETRHTRLNYDADRKSISRHHLQSEESDEVRQAKTDAAGQC